jgi:hypothetical protein
VPSNKAWSGWVKVFIDPPYTAVKSVERVQEVDMKWWMEALASRPESVSRSPTTIYYEAGDIGYITGRVIYAVKIE